MPSTRKPRPVLAKAMAAADAPSAATPAPPARGKAAPPIPPLMASSVAAGFPSPAEQYAEEPLNLNEYLVRNPPATYFVRAAGDSMTGAGIEDGDILVVDRSRDAQDGAIVIACVDGEFTVKRLRRDRGGVRLEAENPKYAPIRFSGDEECRVFGVVTGLVRRLG